MPHVEIDHLLCQPSVTLPARRPVPEIPFLIPGPIRSLVRSLTRMTYAFILKVAIIRVEMLPVGFEGVVDEDCCDNG